MPVYSSIWKGDQDQLAALLLVVKRNCECQAGRSGPACSVHAMLLSQRTIDGLIFARYLAERLHAEEFM